MGANQRWKNGVVVGQTFGPLLLCITRSDIQRRRRRTFNNMLRSILLLMYSSSQYYHYWKIKRTLRSLVLFSCITYFPLDWMIDVLLWVYYYTRSCYYQRIICNNVVLLVVLVIIIILMYYYPSLLLLSCRAQTKIQTKMYVPSKTKYSMYVQQQQLTEHYHRVLLRSSSPPPHY